MIKKIGVLLIMMLLFMAITLPAGAATETTNGKADQKNVKKVETTKKAPVKKAPVKKVVKKPVVKKPVVKKAPVKPAPAKAVVAPVNKTINQTLVAKEAAKAKEIAAEKTKVDWNKARPITLKGSDTMLLLGQRWAEVFMNKNPKAVVQVTGGGSGTGLAALINGTTDIAQSSRPIKDKERIDAENNSGKHLFPLATALDGVAIYLNENNPLQQLTMPQINDIYTGKVKNWKEVGGKDAPIVLYGRENNSGTYVFFKEHVLSNKDFAVEVQTLPGTASVVNAVAKDENGIGYGGIAYSKGIKLAKAQKDKDSKAIEPNMETVRSGEYPLARFLYWYTLSDPRPELQALIEWVVGPEGQKIVDEVGYFPIR